MFAPVFEFLKFEIDREESPMSPGEFKEVFHGDCQKENLIIKPTS